MRRGLRVALEKRTQDFCTVLPRVASLPAGELEIGPLRLRIFAGGWGAAPGVLAFPVKLSFARKAAGLGPSPLLLALGLRFAFDLGLDRFFPQRLRGFRRINQRSNQFQRRNCRFIENLANGAACLETAARCS